MKITLLALLLSAPTWVLGQSLADVAKKEKERRGKNKETGKEVRVISEQELAANKAPAPAQGSEEGVATGASEYTPPPPPSYGGSSESVPETSSSEEGGMEEQESVPDFIPPERPLPEKLEIFEAMKRGYQSKLREIDKSIAENAKRLQEIQGELALLGGTGLPVAPQSNAGASMQPKSGYETEALLAERNKLEAMNEQLSSRKEGLRLDLQAKGRAAGIPPGYLRF